MKKGAGKPGGAKMLRLGPKDSGGGGGGVGS